jgi:hypothetical protein
MAASAALVAVTDNRVRERTTVSARRDWVCDEA